MKKYYLVPLFLFRFAQAQEIALVDRALKKPVSISAELTRTQLTGKQFPIYGADLDSVITHIENLTKTIDAGRISALGITLLPVGRSQLAVTTERKGMYNFYTVFLNTRMGNVGASMQLVRHTDGNKKAVQELHAFLDYLKNNRHLITTENQRLR